MKKWVKKNYVKKMYTDNGNEHIWARREGGVVAAWCKKINAREEHSYTNNSARANETEHSLISLAQDKRKQGK